MKEEEEVVAEEQKVEGRLPCLTSASNSAFYYSVAATLQQANALYMSVDYVIFHPQTAEYNDI